MNIDPIQDWRQIILDLRKHYKNMENLSRALGYCATRGWLGEVSRNGISDIRFSTGIRLLTLHEKHCKKTLGNLA